MSITSSPELAQPQQTWERETQLVSRFLFRYAHVLDSGAFSEWPGLFTEAGTYALTTRENALDLGMSLYLDRGQDALKERAAYVLGYWLTPRRKTLHVITNTLVIGVDGACVTAHSNVVLYQVDRRGESKLHVTGEYSDEIELAVGGPRFVSHRVVLDGSTLPADMSAIL